MTSNTIRRYSVGGIRFQTPALGLNIVTPRGDYGTIFEVVPHTCKDGREVYRCRIAKSVRHESRWVTVEWLRCDGYQYTAV